MALEGWVVFRGGGRDAVEQFGRGECGLSELLVGLAEAEDRHAVAGAAVGSGAVRDPGFPLDPPLGAFGFLADDPDQLGARLEEAEVAVAGPRGDAEIEGLALPPFLDVGLPDAGVGKRQGRALSGAGSAVACADAPYPGGLVGAEPDDGVPGPEAEPVAGEGIDPVALEEAGAEPDVGRGEESLAFDQRGVRLAPFGRGGAVDDAGAVGARPSRIPPSGCRRPRRRRRSPRNPASRRAPCRCWRTRRARRAEAGRRSCRRCGPACRPTSVRRRS